MSSECSQCCREMVSDSRGKFSGQTTDPGRGWGQGSRGKVHFLKTSNKQTGKSCRDNIIFLMVLAHRKKSLAWLIKMFLLLFNILILYVICFVSRCLKINLM